MRPALLLVFLIMLVGCGAGRPYLAHYADADVLYTTPADVNRLCRLAPGGDKPGQFAGCYIPGARLAIVPHGATDILVHELRHARTGAFHP